MATKNVDYIYDSDETTIGESDKENWQYQPPTPKRRRVKPPMRFENHVMDKVNEDDKRKYMQQVYII